MLGATCKMEYKGQHGLVTKEKTCIENVMPKIGNQLFIGCRTVLHEYESIPGYGRVMYNKKLKNSEV